jgi:hypothetical protein
MIKQDINTIFAEHDISMRAQSHLMESYPSSFVKDLFEETGFELQNIASHGGEDEGSEYWAVWKFTRGQESVLVRFNGYYQSHCDTQYLGYEFVIPKEVMVIQYKKATSYD